MMALERDLSVSLFPSVFLLAPRTLLFRFSSLRSIDVGYVSFSSVCRREHGREDRSAPVNRTRLEGEGRSTL